MRELNAVKTPKRERERERAEMITSGMQNTSFCYLLGASFATIKKMLQLDPTHEGIVTQQDGTLSLCTSSQSTVDSKQQRVRWEAKEYFAGILASQQPFAPSPSLPPFPCSIPHDAVVR